MQATQRDPADVLFDLPSSALALLLSHPEFEAPPASFEDFVQDSELLNCEEAWPSVKEILGDCLKGSSYMGRLSSYEEMVLELGIGSGKSFGVSCLFSYGVYWLENIDSPQRYFGLAPKSTIALLNMSKSAMQAKKVVFGDIKARIDNSPWFQKHCQPNPNVHSELRFPKNIVIFPGNSSETFPLGYNVFMANMDEASFYTETEFHDVAQEIYDALGRRITSRFSGRGFLAITSSPRYVDDFTEKKIEEAKTNPKVFARRKPTWEMKPEDIAMVQKGECFEAVPPGATVAVKIPLKYESAFKRNPKKAWRDFGAIASLVLEAYFTDEEIDMLEACMATGIPTEPVPVQGMLYFIHIDLGLKRDACGIAMVHYDSGVIIVDRVLRIVCQRRAEILRSKGEDFDMVIGNDEVSIEGVEQVVYDLAAKGFAIGCVTYDQFQSVASRQRFEANGYPTDLLSVSKNTECYDTMKSLLRTGRFRSVPHAHAVREAKRCELVEGKKVDHPPNGSNDVIEAIVGATKKCMEQFDEEIEVEETIVDETMRYEISEEI